MLSQLQQKVISRIETDHSLRRALAAKCIYWRTPVVGIESILLDEEPNRLTRTFTGVRPLTDKEYEKIYQDWRQNLIGGSQRLRDDHKGKYWYPPQNSQLLHLQTIEHSWNGNGWSYYLLRHRDQSHFLVQLSGDENRLLLVNLVNKDDRNANLYFSEALHNVLMWQQQ